MQSVSSRASRRFRVCPSFAGIAVVCGTLAFATPSFADEPFEDSWIRLELPKGWAIEGESGEYMIDSDTEDIGSLLVLAPDPDRSLEELLADIEAQFLSTGIFALESMEERDVDGTDVHIRHYRMTSESRAEETSTATVIHQFSFWRDDVQVLLQVETGEKSASPERLFSKVFSTLEILESPDPFLYEDAEPFDESEAIEDGLDAAIEEGLFDDEPAVDSLEAPGDSTDASPE